MRAVSMAFLAATQALAAPTAAASPEHDWFPELLPLLGACWAEDRDHPLAGELHCFSSALDGTCIRHIDSDMDPVGHVAAYSYQYHFDTDLEEIVFARLFFTSHPINPSSEHGRVARDPPWYSAVVDGIAPDDAAAGPPQDRTRWEMIDVDRTLRIVETWRDGEWAEVSRREFHRSYPIDPTSCDDLGR